MEDVVTATFHVGDAIEVMNKLPEKSVDLILTSPPFLALRSYLPADHPDKALEGGSQATPGMFIDWLVDVVEACDRVLAPHGSLCIELGDTYAGSSIETREAVLEGSARWGGEDGRPTLTGGRGGTVDRKGTGWPLAKSLSLIPELFRLTLVYGTNPLTGRQTERWRLRNVVRWVRPNPPVGALGDKFRPATSELMVFCKSAKRYFDLDAVRSETPTTSVPAVGDPKRQAEKEAGVGGNGWLMDRTFHKDGGAPPLDWWKIADPGWCTFGWGPCPSSYGTSHSCRKEAGHDGFHICDLCGSRKKSPDVDSDWWNIPLLEGEEETRYGPQPQERKKNTQKIAYKADSDRTDRNDFNKDRYTSEHPNGPPPLDWWNIPPGGYEGAHYAVFPPELCVKPIKAMCPGKVCRQCGEPSRRIVETTRTLNGIPAPDAPQVGISNGDPRTVDRYETVGNVTFGRITETLGFSDCGHNDYRPGVVLDPFVGSGTTLMVATGHGRDAIGIDLDERNYDLALGRVGPFILERA